jgi:hypothetical protein
MKIVSSSLVRHESEEFEAQLQILVKIPLESLHQSKILDADERALIFGKELLLQIENLGYVSCK